MNSHSWENLNIFELENICIYCCLLFLDFKKLYYDITTPLSLLFTNTIFTTKPYILSTIGKSALHLKYRELFSYTSLKNNMGLARNKYSTFHMTKCQFPFLLLSYFLHCHMYLIL